MNVYQNIASAAVLTYLVWLFRWALFRTIVLSVVVVVFLFVAIIVLLMAVAVNATHRRKP